MEKFLTSKLLTLKLLILMTLFTASSCALFYPTYGLPEYKSEGATFYNDNCGPCHKAIHPSTRTMEEWDIVLRRVEYAGEHLPMPPMREEDVDRLRDYLGKYAKVEGE